LFEFESDLEKITFKIMVTQRLYTVVLGFLRWECIETWYCLGKDISKQWL